MYFTKKISEIHGTVSVKPMNRPPYAVNPRLQKSYKKDVGNKSDYPRFKDTQTRPNNQTTEE